MSLHDEAVALLKGQMESLKKNIDMLRNDTEGHMRQIRNNDGSIAILDRRITDIHESLIALNKLKEN